ncbi:MAG: hypothetical protein M4579_005714 [Chaenotheca gracillima]|nr:MAG: hypothetical protein M4579_005714 [Chaenotheca gracillima]
MSDSKQSLLPTEPPPSYESSSQGAPSTGPLPNVKGNPVAKPPLLRAPLPLDLPALNQLKGQRVILASASPRRKQLLAQIGLTNLSVVPSTEPEDFSKSLSPFEYVLQTATKKALTVYRQEINNTSEGDLALIIAADTVVVSHFGDILEKPRSEREHVTMLRQLRDEGAHKVFTAVAVMAPLVSAKAPGYAMETAVEETLVRFDREITDDLIDAYVKTREGVDKAGGYGIQGIGSILVERIEGSFDNVVGLPIRATLRSIEKVVHRAEDEDGMEDLLGDEEEDDVLT